MKCGTYQWKFGLGLALLIFPFSGFAQNLSVATIQKNFPESFLKSIPDQTSELQFKLTNAIFNSPNDSHIYDNDFDPRNTLPLQISRDLYHNYDVLNTYTLVDRVKVYVETQLLTASIAYPLAEAVQFIPFPFANVYFGVKGSADITSVRQVGRPDLELPKPDLLKPSAADIKDLNPYLGLSKLSILGTLNVPLQVPLSSNQIQKMEDGQIISYSISGAVGFGGSIGLKILPSEELGIGAGALVETYIKGSFQISIMRENARYVKVRIARMKGTEKDFMLQAGLNYRNFINGFFIFNRGTIHDLTNSVGENILPFQYRLVSDQEQEIAVAYRYDLNSEEGRNSFHRAVLGSFTQSDEVANHEVASVNPTVQKLYSRASLLKAQEKALAIDIAFFLHKANRQIHQSLDTEIQTEAGSDHLLKNVAEDLREFNSIGNAERMLSKLTVLVDEKLFATRANSSLLITGENTIDDSKTNGSELNQYVEQIQSVLHETNLFPKFPEMVNDFKEPDQQRKAKYGRTSFYFGFSTKEQGLSQFLGRDEALLMAKANQLKIKFNLQAFRDAQAALAKRDARALIASLNTLFSDRKHIREVSDWFFWGVGESEADPFVVAQNPSFGSFQNRGRKSVEIEKALLETDAIPITYASDALKIESLDQSVDEKHHIHLKFKLPESAEFLYFRLMPFSGKDSKQSAEFIIYNRDHHFTAGQNEIILDEAASDPVSHRLTEKLVSGSHYSLSLGIRAKSAESHWSAGKTLQFVAP